MGAGSGCDSVGGPPWYGTRSTKQRSCDTLCLGFLDGGNRGFTNSRLEATADEMGERNKGYQEEVGARLSNGYRPIHWLCLLSELGAVVINAYLDGTLDLWCCRPVQGAGSSRQHRIQGVGRG